MSDRVQKLEESLTHLSQMVDELSDVIARQEREITQLKGRQDMLMQRAAEREIAEGGVVPITDQAPPHW